jgi:hypothetical protein
MEVSLLMISTRQELKPNTPMMGHMHEFVQMIMNVWNHHRHG